MPTNREWATLIWLSLVLGWFIVRGDGWSSIKSVGRALFVPKIIAPLIVYGAYVACLVVIAHGLHGWNRSLTKDTGVWLLTVGLPLLLSLNQAHGMHWSLAGVRHEPVLEVAAPFDAIVSHVTANPDTMALVTSWGLDTFEAAVSDAEDYIGLLQASRGPRRRSPEG